MQKRLKYRFLRIFLISGLFYFFLVMPFMGLIIVQKLPDLMENGIMSNNTRGNIGPFTFNMNENDSLQAANKDSIANIFRQNKNAIQDSIMAITQDIISNPDSAEFIIEEKIKANEELIASNADGNENSENEDEDMDGGYFGTSFFIFFYGMEIILVLGFLFSIPYKIYFRKKRKGKNVSQKLEDFCRKYLLHTPLINAGLFGSVMLATVIYIAYVNLFVDLTGNIRADIFDEYLYIASLAGFLSTIFVYYWQKHRVHIFYLEVLYKEDELRKRIFRKNIGRIRNRLWLASGMTTLLPLGIVIFYLILSVTRLSDLDLDYTNEQIRKVVMGEYSQFFDNDNDLGQFLYINSVNAYMMFIGIGTSIFVSLIYILTFVRWTTVDIVFPVKELLGNMQQTGQGKTNHFSIVRTNDEIGELAEGFNKMSNRITNYIDHINEINTSYYRFVPKQFLDFLDKTDVTDIKLGDQVQKEMTVMFSDIRSFTEISEDMDPKDNFNFINHYLGYMEPVISKNNGFIDKYIGDAIMALFAESVDDALDAAIEMRFKLDEFNEDLRLNGKRVINNGIGINTGSLMLGIVGGTNRLEGTVISDHVNLASRLEGLTKKYGTSIIISQDTLDKIKDPSRYNSRFLDKVVVKGKRNSVNIYEILNGEPLQIKKEKMATKVKFSNAIDFYQKKKFSEALVLLNEIIEESPNDLAAKLYVERCKSISLADLPNDWDGTEFYNTK